MNEPREFFPSIDNSSNPPKLKIFDPYQNQTQKLYLIGESYPKEVIPYSSPSKGNCRSMDGLWSLNSNSVSLDQTEKSATINKYNSKKIIIDLQKEYDEDQELLDLLDPQIKKSPTDQKQTGIKALFKLKQSKIEIIPEEDEDKQKPEQNLFVPKERDNQKFNKNINDNKNAFPNRYLRKMQLDIYNNKDNLAQSQQLLCTQNKLSVEKERKEIAVLLSPPSIRELNGCLVSYDKNNETPSTSGITQESIKNKINYNNNYIDDTSKRVKYGYLTQKIDLLTHKHISPNQISKKGSRPLSNPHSSNLNLKKEENVICNQNIHGMINDLINSKDFTQKDKKRIQLGSAHSQTNHENEKLFKYSFKNNDPNNNMSNLRQIHKIKIERGLASSKLIEKFSKQLSYDYTSDFNKNKGNNYRKHNEPIKIIQM